LIQKIRYSMLSLKGDFANNVSPIALLITWC
jgi:hypothetical protein